MSTEKDIHRIRILSVDDHLLLRDGQLVEARAAGNVQAQPFQIRLGVGVDFFAVDEAERSDERFAA